MQKFYILNPISNAIRNVGKTTPNTRFHVVEYNEKMKVDVDVALHVYVRFNVTLLIPEYVFTHHRTGNMNTMRFNYPFAYMDNEGTAHTGFYLHDNARYVLRDFFENYNMYHNFVRDTNANMYNYFNGFQLTHNTVYTQDEGHVVADRDELYVCEDGNYYLFENNVPERESKYVSDYHEDDNDYEITFNGGIDPKTGKPYQFFVGCEIEKEDYDMKTSVEWDDFKLYNENYRKERDGSLDGESGYELVTPKMPLDIDGIYNEIMSRSMIRDHINADYNYQTCGGHIHVSSPNIRGDEMYDRISGYLPILAALYPSRGNAYYSRMLGKSWMKFSREKRQAVKVMTDRIEFRIFSAVKNVNQLMWRLRLVEYMVQNPATVLSDVNMETLKPLLDEIHNTEQKSQAFFARIQEWNAKIDFQTDAQYPSAYNRNLDSDAYPCNDYCEEDYNH